MKKICERSRPEFTIARPQAFSFRYMIAESTYAIVSFRVMCICKDGGLYMAVAGVERFEDGTFGFGGRTFRLFLVSFEKVFELRVRRTLGRPGGLLVSAFAGC